MKIQNEKNNEAVQEIIITIETEDYAENVEKMLKKERRTAQIPGFRVGNAPMGMIKKAYEKRFIVDEVNRLLYEKLYGYLRDNKLQILGEPLPIDAKTSVDFDKNDPFVFAFEYALQPEVSIDFAKLPAAKSFKVNASDDEKQQYIDNLRNRHGEYTAPEEVGENDSVSVNYGEKSGFLFVKDLTKAGKKAVVGKKMNEEFEFALRDMFADDAALARFLKVKEEELEADNKYSFKLKVMHIGRMVPAELNEDFFKKAFPDGSVTDEKQLNEVAAKEIEAQWKQETDRYFMTNSIDVLLENVKIDLPDEFLKRFILAADHQGVNADNIDEKYVELRKSFQWQLLENKIVADNNITVSNDEVKDYIRNFFMKNYFYNFDVESVKDQLETLVADALKRQDDVKKIYDQLYDQKIMEVLRSKMKVEESTGSFEDFVAAATGKSAETEKTAPKKKAAPKKTTTKKTTKTEETK